MHSEELNALLEKLCLLPSETEWVEFKSNYLSSEEIGEYLSALSNSACLRRKSKGYLVFGIENNTHIIKGTTFDPTKEKGKGNQDFQI